MPQHCFTYGSLMCEDIMAAVCDLPIGKLAAYRAALAGFVRHPVTEESYPGIIPASGAMVVGVVYVDVPEAAWPRLDRFEGEMYERLPVMIRLEDGASLEAHSYVIRPHFVDRLAAGEWDSSAFLREGKAQFIARYLAFREL